MSMLADISKFGLLKKSALLRAQLHGEKRVVVFGDSITASNSFYDATNHIWQYGSSYAEQALWGAGMHFKLIANTGVPGNTTTQMMARFATDVLAWKPNLVIFMAGTNDMISGAGNTGLATMMNNIESMIIQMLANNILPVLVTPPVKSATSPADGSPIGGNPETRNCIRYFYELANFYGLPFVDSYKITCDPVTGNYRTGWSADGVHPQFAGIRAISSAVSTVLNSMNSFGQNVYLAPFGNASIEDANLIANGSMAKQTTANNPDSINPVGTSITASTLATLPYVGKILQLTHANGAGYCFNTSSVPAAGGWYSAGDALEFSGYCQSAGLTESGTQTGFTVALNWATNNLNVEPINSMTCNGTYGFSIETIVPASSGDLTCYAYAPDAGTYQFGSLTLTNKTKMQSVWKPGSQ